VDKNDMADLKCLIQRSNIDTRIPDFRFSCGKNVINEELTILVQASSGLELESGD
jgi:hypothetical protein